MTEGNSSNNSGNRSGSSKRNFGGRRRSGGKPGEGGRSGGGSSRRRNRSGNRNRTRDGSKSADTRSSNRGNRGNRSRGGGSGQRKNYRRRRRYGRPLSAAEQLQRKYLNLLINHNVARKKYYEYYYRSDTPQLNKLERHFYRTLDELREFENGLSQEQLSELQKARPELKLDLDYSNNHQLDPEHQVVELDHYDDPHVLTSMSERDSYANDEEESMGSMEDYLAYKNIS